MTGTRRIALTAARLELLERLQRAEGMAVAPGRTVPRRPDPDVAVPLTFAQRRFWFLDRLAAHDGAYVVSAALRVRGPFRFDLFRQACAEVVHRHESLRTVFAESDHGLLGPERGDGGPVQRVLADLPPEITEVDLRGTAPDDVPRVVGEREAALVARPFDLTSGPLLRLELLDFADGDAAVLVNLHHIVCDRWSMSVLLAELTTGYAVLAAGAPRIGDALPPLPVQYPDYAVWQQKPPARQAWDADLDYWVDRLRGIPPELSLTCYRGRPRVKSYRGSSVPIELPGAVVEAVRELARREGATVFMVLAAVWAVLLRRLGATTDVVVGTPIAGRTLAETEPLVGLFLNTVALRTDLSGNPSFRQTLHRMRAACVEAYAHQGVPFERLVERLQPERSLSRTPVFQVLISFQNVPVPTRREGPVSVEPLPLPSPKAEFDLLLDLFEDGDRIWGRLEHCLDLLDAADAESIGRLLVRLASAVTADPDAAVEEVSLLDDVERRSVAARRGTGGDVVLDERGQPLPAGVPGELHRGDLATGLRARWWPERQTEILGECRAHGRVRGLRVELDRVEAVLARHLARTHPGVEAAVAAWRHHPEGPDRPDDPDHSAQGAQIIAYVAGDDRPTAKELTAAVADELPDYMVPSAVLFLPRPVRTPEGALDRAALPAVDLVPGPAPAGGSRGGITATDPADPADPAESALVRLWCDLLDVPHVGVHDNFFDLGGHSLLIPRLSAAVTAEFGVRLSMRDLFDQPTVAGLAERIRQQPTSSPATPDAIPDVIPAVDRSAPLPLSFAQEWLCTRHPLGPEDPCHTVVTGLLLQGPLQADDLVGALQDATARQEALRARFVRDGSQWRQVIETEAGWPTETVDLRAENGHDRQARLRELVRGQAARPFRIGAEPLVRASLVRLRDEETALVLAMHHLVTDNWSYGILVRDVCALYAARVTEQRAALPALPVQFGDVAAWQQRRRRDGSLTGQLDFWRSELAALRPLTLAAPPGHPTAAATGTTCSFTLDAARTAGVQAVAQRAGTSLFAVLLAALDVLLGAAGRTDDVAVAVKEAGRQRPETVDLVGYLVNTVVVRTRLDAGEAFTDLVARVRDRALAASAHADVPFADAAESGGPESGGADPGRVVFNLLNAPIPAVQLPGVSARPLELGDGYVFAEVLGHLDPAEVDLALIMREDAGTLRGTWLYALDRQDADAIGWLLDRWPVLVDRILSDPEVTVGDLFEVLDVQVLDGRSGTGLPGRKRGE